MSSITRFCRSSLAPSIATGAVAGVGMVGYTAVSCAKDVASRFFGSLVSYKVGIDLTSNAAVIGRVPTVGWLGGAAVGGAVGLTVAVGYELGKKALKKDGDKEQDSNSLIPTGITGAVMGAVASAAPSVAINEGINYVFEKPLFGLIAVRGPKIMWQISKWTGRTALDYVYSWIPSTTLSSQEVMVGAACGVALGAAAIVTYQVAKKVLSQSNSTQNDESAKSPSETSPPSPPSSPKKYTHSGRSASSAMKL